MATMNAPESRVSKNRNMACSTKIYKRGLVYTSETTKCIKTVLHVAEEK